VPKEPKATRALNALVVPLDIPLQDIQKARSSMPPDVRLSDIDCAILLFAERNRNLPFSRWPKECKNYKALAKLGRRGYLKRSDFPKRYYITPSGFGMARWILAALQSTGTKPDPSKA
jgi:hypothetical protein